MEGPIDMEQKDTTIGYWTLYTALIFYHISGMGGRIDIEQKGYALIECLTLTFDLTHDLYLGLSRSNF